MKSKWIVCQLGAREHYAVARALHRRGELAALVTDFWVPPGSWLSRVPAMQRLRERWHPDLAEARVLSMNTAMLGFEFLGKLARRTPWDGIMARNAFFQKQALGLLSTFNPQPLVLFSYSYAAGELFRAAKQRSWITVLGQIDPGPEEERIVREVSRRHGVVFEPAPPEYWNEWRKETELADRIVLNSAWSKDCLVKEGIAEEKMVVVPLAYEAKSMEHGAWSGERAEGCKIYPAEFSKERPMRVLFLGQVNVRKGVMELLEAARMLKDEPIEFLVVGGVTDGLLLKNVPGKVRVVGAVERGEAEQWYGEADVFVLPTHSDGFALTQLEAQARGLPVIASKYCGDVVRDGVNGVLLPEVGAKPLAEALHALAVDPQRVASMAAEAGVDERFSLRAVGQSLSDAMDR